MKNAQSQASGADSSASSATSPRSARDEVFGAILEIAPDLDPEDLEPNVDLHYDLGLDSIDLLNIAGSIAERTGCEIPERDYTRLHTVGELLEYIEERYGEEG